YFANISSSFANVQDATALSNSAVVNGSANYDSLTHTFVLTPDVGDQAGSAMLNRRIDLSYDFQGSFDVYLGSNSNGADGLAFVLQNDPRGPTRSEVLAATTAPFKSIMVSASRLTPIRTPTSGIWRAITLTSSIPEPL